MIRSVFYSIVKILLLIFFKLYNRLSVRWAGRLPDGPVIVASNHASNIDPPLVGGVFPRRLRYLAKESLFDNPALGFLITALGAIPVKREDGQRAGAVMKMMLRLLAEGESILIFPEGSRSADGRLKPLEGGAALLSIKSNLPVIPVYISGSRSACPPGSAFPRPAKLVVTFAEAIYPASYEMPSDREKRTAIMADLEVSLKLLERKSMGDDRS